MFPKDHLSEVTCCSKTDGISCSVIFDLICCYCNNFSRDRASLARMTPCLSKSVVCNFARRWIFHFQQIYTVGVLQIRRGKGDNLGIIFHITPLKQCCDP